MNVCTFLGRLTKDVEVKTVGETEIANFTLAVDRKFKKEGQPTADFLNFVAFGKTAEVISEHCKKGSQIAVVSRVQTRTWDDKDGNKRYITEFLVESFSFAGSKPKSDDEFNL
jgi:single-strand DNA-binding protein